MRGQIYSIVYLENRMTKVQTRIAASSCACFATCLALRVAASCVCPELSASLDWLLSNMAALMFVAVLASQGAFTEEEVTTLKLLSAQVRIQFSAAEAVRSLCLCAFVADSAGCFQTVHYPRCLAAR